MNESDLILNFIVGAFISPLISMVNSESWPPFTKRMVAAGISVAFGVGLAFWHAGGLPSRFGVESAVLAVYGASALAYAGLATTPLPEKLERK